MPSAEIITIGTEILLGEIVDTNTRYIARTLRGMGVDIYRTITIGDNIERIAEAIHNSMNRAEIVITTGGLGPTVKGAVAIPNPVGTAPCFIVETERNSVISLPGVPNEMEYILHESIIPYLQKRFNLNEIIKIRILHCAGLGEGMIDEKIDDLETLSNPTVGLAAHTGVVDIRIAAKAKSEAEADQMIAQIEGQIHERLGDVVFGADEDKLEDIVLNTVAKRGWTLVGVESGLDGLLARKISHTVSLPNLSSDSLMVALRAARADSNADAALGVAMYLEERAAEMALITPKGEKTHRITYGGPPRSLARWSVNLALDWLRRRALEKD